MAQTKGMDRSLLEAAVMGYQHQLAFVAAKVADIKRRLRVRAAMDVATAPTNGARRKEHQISPVGRARIAAAQKKRWAAAKKAKTAAA